MPKVIRKKGTGYDKLRNTLGNMPTMKVGFFDTKYPKKKGQKGPAVPVAYVAAIHEFGSPKNNIPPRSFMRTTAIEQAGAWRKAAREIFKPVMLGNATSAEALDKLGFIVEGDIAAKITQISSPPLKQATIDRKGDSKPLVETGLLLQSVTHQVDA